MSEGRRSRGLVVGTFAAAVVVAVVVVANAPANWLARFIVARSGGHVLLADAEGTVWSGSAVLAFAGVAVGSGPGERLALPGRVTWRLETLGGLAPVLHLTQDAVLARPLAMRYVDGDLVIEPGAATVPVGLLRLAGAPFNTLLSEGRCLVAWDGSRWTRDGVLEGAGTAAVNDFAVALSPVRPLGDYRVAWRSGGDGAAWTIATARGPLAVDGEGRLGRNAYARVRVRAADDAPPPVAARLAPLIDAIGRRSPTEAVFEWGRT